MSMEKKEFRAELKQVMDIIVHSLYSHREIFLRELISNACDAIDRLRFDAIQKPELVGDDHDWKIVVAANKQNGTLTVSDNGGGMTRDDMIENLGTIARSGTKSFLEKLKAAEVKDRPELIGQFGVGFYSAFMVADEVTVLSRAAGTEQGHRWVCSGGEGYGIEEDATAPRRGTRVILRLREDAREFLSEWTLRDIVKKYSDFTQYPIELELVDEKGNSPAVTDAVMNSMKALWMRPRNDIKEEEYNEFYKQISHDQDNPLRTIHYAAEGALEFRALLFLPVRRPFDFFFGERKGGVALYIQRVQIMNPCDKLLPMYLRFAKGVVDSSDLPLNVSREMVQHNPLLDKMRKTLTGKILGELEELKNKSNEDYLKFFKEFGDVLKEGIGEDFANREKLADLMLFHSTTAADDKSFVTLEKYCSTLGEEQKEILYLSGEHLEALAVSPYLEPYKATGREVLLLTSPMDEWALDMLREYKGKTFKAIDRGDYEPGADEKKALDEQKERFAPLLQCLNNMLPGLKDVRLSARLKNSASCLVTPQDAMTAQMERMMRKLGQDIGPSERILELNPAHEAVKALAAIYEKNRTDPRVELFGRLLHEEALIAEGSRLPDPAAFAERINRLMAMQAGTVAG